MAQDQSYAQLLSTADAAVTAFELGISDYETALLGWSGQIHQRTERDAAVVADDLAKRRRALDAESSKLTARQAELDQAIAAFDHQRKELKARETVCTERDRELIDRSKKLDSDTKEAEQASQKTQAQLATAVEEHEAQSKALAADRKALDKARADFEQRTAAITEQEGALREAEGSIATTRKELDNTRSELGRKETSLKKQKRSLDEMKREVEAQVEKIQHTLADIKEREDKIAKRSQALEREQTESVKGLNARKAELQAELEAFESRRVEWNAARKQADDHASTRQVTLERQIAALEKKNKQVDDRTRNLETRQQSIDKQSGELESRLGELEVEIEGNREMRELLDTQRRSLERDQVALEKRNAQLDERRGELDRMLAEFESSRSQLESRRDEITTSIDDRERELSEKLKEVSARNLAFDDRVQKLEKRERTVDTIHGEAKEKDAHLAAMNDRLKERETKFDNERSEVRKRQQEWERERAEAVAAQKELQESIAAQRQQVEQADLALAQSRKAVESKQKSATQTAHEIQRRSADIEAKQKTLAEREMAISDQRERLEATLSETHRSEAASAESQRVADELAEARKKEFAEAQQQAESLRTEVESLRGAIKDLEAQVETAQVEQGANADDADNAHREVVELESNLKKQRMEFEERNAILQDERNALDARAAEIELRERDALALMEEMEQGQSGDGERETQYSATVDASAVHGAVASFWESFDLSALPTNDAARPPMVPVTPAEPITPPDGADHANNNAEPAPDDEIEDTQAAMRAALTAARAELEQADQEPAPGTKRSGKANKSAPAAKVKSANDPIKITRESLMKRAKEEEAGDTAAKTKQEEKPLPQDLDAAALQQLRMLRRLNPNQSDEQLLGRINTKPESPGGQKQKRGWFSR